MEDFKTENSSIRELDRYLFSKNPVPMLVFNRLTHQIIKVNEAAVEKYGYSVEKFEEMNIKDLHSKEEVPVLLKHLEGIDKELQNPYHQHQKKCGDVFYAQVSSQNFSWQERDVQLAVIHDVSGQVEAQHRAEEAEREVREERKFSNLLFKNLPDIFLLINDQGNVVRWNDTFEQLTGLGKDEISGQFAMNFFYEHDRMRMQETMQRVFQKGKGFTEGRLVTKEGRKIPHQLAGVKLNYRGNQYMVGTGVNIQQQKDRQKKLEETDKELSRAQQIASIGSFEWDVVNDEINFSDEAYRIYGIDPQKNKKPGLDKIFEIIHPEDQEFVENEVNEMLEGKGFENFEHRLCMANGEVKHVMERGDVEYDDDGLAVKVFGTIQDISERKKIEIKLSKRSKAIESSMDGVAILGDNGQYTFMNEAHASIYGYDSPAELIGKNWKTLYKKKGLENLEKEIFTALENDGVWKGETLAKCKDGSAITTDVTLSNVEGGGITCIVRDITELKKNRGNLKRAQEIAQVGSFEWDVVNDELDYSAEAYNIYGIEYLAGEKPDIDQFVEVIHPEDRQFVNKQIGGILNGNGFEKFEHRLLTPNGTEKHVIQRGDVEYADDGSAVTVFGTVQDITRQKKVEVELAKRSKAIESSIDGVGILDINGKYTYINEAFAAIYGYKSPVEVIGKDWRSVCGKEEVIKVEQEIFPILKIEREWKGEINAKRKDGSVFPTETSLSSTEGNGLICITRDITDRKKAEKQIQDSLQEKDVLLAEIHHRVKNNLAIISSLLKLVAMSHENDTTIKKVMNESHLRIQSMAMIHEKLYQTANFTDIKFENYIEELVDTISATMNTAGRDISINIDSDDITLNINYAIPCALLINELVTNAFKHAFNDVEEGVLNINLKCNDDLILIKVEDNGPGLPENFEEKSKSSLGYILIKQLTKQLKGELKIEGTNGACFQVQFLKGQKSGSYASDRV